MTVSPEPIHYLTRSDIGRVFGVTHDAVLKWQQKWTADSAHPFPAPDAYAGELRPAPLWLPERLGEIREWREWFVTRPVNPGGRPRGSRLGGQVLRD